MAPLSREEYLARVLEPGILNGSNGTAPHGLVSDEDPVVASYESAFAEAISTTGSIYEPMSPMIQAAHERRMEILDGLDVGDLTESVCVDFGVGSWGFACIYPRLQRCGFAVGFDISGEAVKESDRISRTGEFPYGDRFVYMRSRGDGLDLRDSVVDLFFTGECIEHIENTDAFLDEIHRVLKPRGTLILTTPNSAAYFYQRQGEQFAVGPEHLALMSYSELLQYLEPRFDVVAAHGFNGSLHRNMDDLIVEPEVARRWAAMFNDRPDLATGMVIVARSRAEYRPARFLQTFALHDDPAIRRGGRWEVIPLHRAITGLRAQDGRKAQLDFTIEGDGVILNFWCHDWGGRAGVSVAGRHYEVELYEPVGGFRRLHIYGLPPGKQRVRVRGLPDRDPRSAGNQLIFYQAVVYHRS